MNLHRPSARYCPVDLWAFLVSAWNAIAMVTAIGSVTGCALPPRSMRVDQDVNFAAHLGDCGIVIDRMEGGRTAVLVRTRSLPASGGPTHVLQASGQTVAALWIAGPDEVRVRQTVDPAAPVIGQVHAYSEHGVIRLSFESTDGGVVRTSSFARSDGHFMSKDLEKELLSVSGEPGIYRANLQDPGSVQVGWLRVRLSSYMAASHIYDGLLPARLDGSLAAAAVLLLESQIGEVDQNARDAWWWD